MSYDLVVKGGSVVLPSESIVASVLVKGEKIAGLLQGGDCPEAKQVIDASGKYVLPGLIDVHVHFREPGLTYKEDFYSGSMAAACGGITTVFDMPNVQPPTADPESFKVKAGLAAGRSFVDFGLIAAILPGNLGRLEELAAEGAACFKLFMIETTGHMIVPGDGEILEAMRVIAATGLCCAVHAENESILNYYTGRLKSLGRNDPLAHHESRPVIAETEAIARCIIFARETGCRLHICHLSSQEGMMLIRQAKEWGSDLSAETAPHYLFLDQRYMKRLGSRLKVNPPLRQPADRAALWQGLLDGAVDLIASDHAPHAMEEKVTANIWEALSGFCGVETSLPLMLTAVNRGKLTLNQLVALTAERPARRFNLYPHKGSLLPGADADMTIIELEKEKVLYSRDLHSKNKMTPFEGFKTRGLPVMTLLRGAVVMKEGELPGAPRGKLVRPQL